MLRDRAGDFMLNLMSEASGYDEEPGLLSAAPFGDCSRDTCIVTIKRGENEWRLLATRTSTRLDWEALVRACSEADIVVSDRQLPRGCRPRWLRLDRQALGRTGGVSIYLKDQPRIETVAGRLGRHPWALTER
jgi:competence protein ComEC